MGFLDLAAFTVAAGLAWITLTIFTSSLKQYPGPFLAKLTNFWRFFDVAKGRHHDTLSKLHHEYGPIVRIGPNVLSLADARWTKVVYPTRGGPLKSEFYSVNDVIIGGRRLSTIFGVRDPDRHKHLRKPVARLYTFSNVMNYEPQIDTVIALLLSKVQKCDLGGLDVGKQLLFFSYDFIGNITFGQPNGYLDQQRDFNGFIAVSHKSLDYLAAVGQIPWSDRLLAKNPIMRIGPPTNDSAAKLCYSRLLERKAGDRPRVQRDFLDDVLELEGSDSGFDVIYPRMIINIAAGADTTAISLIATVYYLLKNPGDIEKLRKELDSATLSLPIIYGAVRSLPYLTACVQESQRLLPAVGLPLERVAPKEGLQLPGGPFIPPGTVIGMNAFTVNRDQNIYGSDPESFKPQRWLQGKNETVQAFATREKAMKESDLTFGMGERVCLGKSVAIVAIYKVIATLFLLYDMELVAPEKELRITNSWFIRQEGLDVKFKRRRATTAT